MQLFCYTKERHFQSSDLKMLQHRGYVGLKDTLTVDLSSVYLLSRVDIVIRNIELDFPFGLPDYVRYIEGLVTSRFYSIHFTVTLAGT